MKGYQLPITIITNHLRKHPVLQTNKSVYCFKHAFCLGMAQNGMLLRVTCVKGDHVGDQLVEGDVPIELASCSAATHLQFNTQLLGFGNISLLHLHLVDAFIQSDLHMCDLQCIHILHLRHTAHQEQLGVQCLAQGRFDRESN